MAYDPRPILTGYLVNRLVDVMTINDTDVQLFVSIGLSEQKAKETLKNVTVTNNLKEAIDAVSTGWTTGSCPPESFTLFCAGSLRV